MSRICCSWEKIRGACVDLLIAETDDITSIAPLKLHAEPVYRAMQAGFEVPRREDNVVDVCESHCRRNRSSGSGVSSLEYRSAVKCKSHFSHSEGNMNLAEPLLEIFLV